MRSLWKTVAVILVVLFIPGSVHCAPGDFSEAERTSAHQSNEIAGEQRNDSHHECLAKSLTATQLPAFLKTPGLPHVDLYSPLPVAWAMSFAALLYLSNAELGNASNSSGILLDSPEELRAQWAFVTRTALPARWPSILV